MFKEDTEVVIPEGQPQFFYKIQPIRQRDSIYTNIKFSHNKELMNSNQKPYQRVKFQMKQSKKPRKIMHSLYQQNKLILNSYSDSNNIIYKTDPKFIMTNKHKFRNKKSIPNIIDNHSRKKAQAHDIHLNQLISQTNTILSFKQQKNLKSLKLKLALEWNDYKAQKYENYLKMGLSSSVTSLQEFSFKSNFNNDSQLKILGDFLKGCSNLKALMIDIEEVKGFGTDNGILFLFRGIVSCQKLTRFNFSLSCQTESQFSDVLLEQINTFLNQAMNLISFKLDIFAFTEFNIARGGFKKLFDIKNEQLFESLQMLQIKLVGFGEELGIDGFQQFIKVLKKCHNLYELIIDLQVSTNESLQCQEEFLSTLNSYQNLAKLDVQFCDMKGYNFFLKKVKFLFSDLLKSNLTSIHFRNLSYRNFDRAKQIFEQLSQVKSLEELSVTNLKFFDFESVKIFTNLCKSQKQLKHLYLYELKAISLSQEVLDLLHESLGELANLEEFYIYLDRFSKDIISPFMNSLKYCYHLRKILIQTNEYCSNKLLQPLAILMRNNSNSLTNLELECAGEQDFQDNDLYNFFQLLQKMQSLVYLKLSGNQFGTIKNETAIILIESLSQLPILEKVSLYLTVQESKRLINIIDKLNLKEFIQFRLN